MKLTTEQLKGLGYWESSPGQWVRTSSGTTPTHVSMKTVAQPKPPRRIRQSTKPLMNKLESEWFEVLKMDYAIVIPQSMRFMLGNGIWYKPDFIVWPLGNNSCGMRAFEVKGDHAFRGGFENLKVVANKYQNIQWFLVWKEEGIWKEQTVLP